MIKARTDDGVKQVVGCMLTYTEREEHHWCNVCKMECSVKNKPISEINGKWRIIDLDKKEESCRKI